MPTFIRGNTLPSTAAAIAGADPAWNAAFDARQKKKTKASKAGFAVFLVLAFLLIGFVLLYVFIRKSGTSLLMPGVAGAGILLLIGTKLFGERAFGMDEKRRDAEAEKAAALQDRTAENLFSALPEGYIVFRNLSIRSASTGQTVLLETVVLGESGVTLLSLRSDKGVIRGQMDGDSFMKAEQGSDDEKKTRNPVRTLRPAMLALQDYLAANGFRVMVRGAVAYTDPSVSIEVTGYDPVSDIRLFACPGCENGELTSYLTDGLHRMPPQTVRSVTELLWALR
ncbi:MAG: NERD domain-containing protein [Clostridia bacterium]|nr:NERD domain-containing protein [Clostridia bacterium]